MKIVRLRRDVGGEEILRFSTGGNYFERCPLAQLHTNPSLSRLVGRSMELALTLPLLPFSPLGINIVTVMFRVICLLTALVAVTQARLLHQEEKVAHMRSAVDDQLQGLRDDDGGGVGADWCADPVKKGKVVFPEPLIGRAQVNFDMYAGYVNVTQADYLYYWYFSAIDQNPNAPLVIWTNGGPGCSSMEGATTENGPLNLFDIKESCEEGGRGADQTCDYTGQLSSNQFAWNNHAHMVYVDQPRFVGNSGGGKGSEGVHSSVDAAQDFVTFYKGLMEIFPEFANKELIIAGESYGGHYIPAFAQALLDENNNNGGSIPFAGAVIGNGCVDDTVQNGDRYVDFAHAQNLIPEDSDPHGQAAASAEMEKFLGYTPNYYDYRLQSIPCRGCFGYDYNAWSHWFIQVSIICTITTASTYTYTYTCPCITTSTDSPPHAHTRVACREGGHAHLRQRRRRRLRGHRRRLHQRISLRPGRHLRLQCCPGKHP